MARKSKSRQEGRGRSRRRSALLFLARWSLPAELLSAFAGHKISAETSQTGQAANTYNILLEEGRRVAAALIAVD